jgi:hypothetical protein
MSEDKPAAIGREAIPTSNALAEASIDSLSELFSRDPEGLSRQDIARMVADLRARRRVWAEAEAKAPSGRKPAAGKAASLISTKSIEDLGL